VVTRLRRLGTQIAWSLPAFDQGLRPPFVERRKRDDEEDPAPPELDAVAPAAASAVRIRSDVAAKKSKAALTKMGIRVEQLRSAYRAALREGEEARSVNLESVDMSHVVEAPAASMRLGAEDATAPPDATKR
jgi:hypothetical protein